LALTAIQSRTPAAEKKEKSQDKLPLGKEDLITKEWDRVRFVEIAGGGHNDTCIKPNYFESIERFWNECVSVSFYLLVSFSFI
jgi:hypothetical protein